MTPHYLRNRKLKFGVGINDADYPVNPMINGKRKICPFYSVWSNMIRRCYVDDKNRRPGFETPYIGCSVVEEWHRFSVFKSWMETQDWKGKQLDKDLKIHGNKVYGPETCIFIPREINILISLGRSSKCGLKKGLHMDGGRIRAEISRYGKKCHIGHFHKEEDAHQAWIFERKKYITEVSNKTESPIKEFLLNWMECEYK